MGKLILRMNNKSRAVTQYDGLSPRSFCKFNGKVLAAGDDGLYEIERGDTDNGEKINAYMKFPVTDFGMSNNKRIRAIYVGYTATSDLQFTVTDDEENKTDYTLPLNKNRKQNTSKLNAGRNYNKGCYFQFAISNLDGGYFDLDFVKIFPVILSRRPGGF